MKPVKHIILLLLIQLTTMAVAQKSYTYVKTYKDGDTTLWYKWHKENLTKVNLPDISSGKDSMTFRIMREGMLLSISTNNNFDYKGFITFYYDKILKHGEYGINKKKFIYKTFNLPADTAKLIGNYFTGKNINKIPPADSLNWHSGNDGTTYIIEYSTATEYTFKDYWCPGCGYQQSPYDTVINALKKYIKPIVTSYETRFINTLKPGEYSDGSIMNLLVPSRKMDRQFRKSRKKIKKA